MSRKVFISQPMNNRTEEEILNEREDIINAMDKDLYILDSFLTGAKDVNPLVCLGHALTILSKANFAVFAPDWEKARGCVIEHQCCVDYGIPIYYAAKYEGSDEWDFVSKIN